MTRFWLSWYQPLGDHRPITFPPPEPILGWWCSGETVDAWTLCAAVDAESEEKAWEIIRQKDAWPDAGEVRISSVREKNWVPGDRFPLSDWMKPRFEKK